MKAGAASVSPSAAPGPVLVQLVLVTLILASYIWIWRHSFRASQVTFTVLLVVVLIWSHRKRHDSLRDLGIRLDTALRTTLVFAPIALVVISAIVAAGAWMGTLRFPPIGDALWTLGWLFIFGTAQQYMLLAFYYRGIASIVHAPLGAALLAAAVFAAFHIPNVFLIGVTFLAGAIAIAVYRRSPNLWINGIVHALISFTLYYSLPFAVTHNLRVGPGYWQ